MAGSLFTLHGSQIHINLPTLSDKDKEVGELYDLHIVIFLDDFIEVYSLVLNIVYFTVNFRLYLVGECKTKLISSHYHILDMPKMFDKYISLH